MMGNLILWNIISDFLFDLLLASSSCHRIFTFFFSGTLKMNFSTRKMEYEGLILHSKSVYIGLTIALWLATSKHIIIGQIVYFY